MPDVLLATVIGPQGLKGEVRVKLFTDAAAKLGGYGPLRTGDGRILRIVGVCDAKAGEGIVAFEGIADRTAAEQLKGTNLYVAREALPETGENEFYHSDLIGLRADDSEDRTIGRVRAIHNYGAGDVIEIERPDGDSVLLAFTRANVRVIDVKSGRVVIAVPEEIEADRRGAVE
jgi:16S rRNA processing protein RimM